MRIFLRKLGGLSLSFPLVLVLLALCAASYFAISSATYLNEKLADAPNSQIRYDIAGMVVFLFMALTPYQLLVRAAPYLYGIGLVLLVCVFVPGLRHKVYNAYSWIKLGPLPIQFEPTEFAKIAYILFLAWFLHIRERKIESFTTVLMAWGFTLVPFVLILKQPALGSASVFFPICFCMLFAAGARLRYIVLPLLAVIGMITLTYYWVHVWDKPIPGLKDFQQKRVQIFFDPTLDPKGAGWQSNQSTIAIGSGGWQGKGWRQGTETDLGYLPRTTSYNDLIFSVVGEIFGFRGAAALILCEGAILLWCVWVASRAREKVGALLAVGVMTMLFTHVFVNIGMTIQVVPITGIPLPFISYGGTFVITCLAAVGLVQSVWVHRKNLERA